MADLIIKKKDLENLGRKLMKEVYEFLHDEHILSFEEMKVEKDKLEKYLIKFYFEMIDESIYENCLKDKSKYQNCIKAIKKRIEDENLEISLIFEVLDRIKLEFEIDEDLFDKKRAFKYIYLVFEIYYNYLKD